MSVINIHNTC